MKQIPNISIGIKEIKIVSNLQIRRIPEYLVPPETSMPCGFKLFKSIPLLARDSFKTGDI